MLPKDLGTRAGISGASGVRFWDFHDRQRTVGRNGQGLKIAHKGDSAGKIQHRGARAIESDLLLVIVGQQLKLGMQQ